MNLTNTLHFYEVAHTHTIFQISAWRKKGDHYRLLALSTQTVCESVRVCECVSVYVWRTSVPADQIAASSITATASS